jgi:predicted phage tail protein
VKTETIQKIKDHLISCLAGFLGGVVVVVAVKLGAERFTAWGIWGAVVLVLSPWLKGWRFLSALFGAMLAGILSAAFMIWFGIPIPAWFRG